MQRIKQQSPLGFLRGFWIAAGVTCVVSCGAGWLMIHAPVRAEYWVAEMMTVKRDLARQSAGRRKVVVAGGSSVLFGFDAGSASQQLQMPVLNHGLHAGMRLETILREVVTGVENGDTVVLALEPPFYTREVPWSAWQVRNTIAWDHASWDALGASGKLGFLLSISPRLLAEMLFASWGRLAGAEVVVQRRASRSPEAVLERYRARSKPSEFQLSVENLNGYGDLLGTENAAYHGPGSDVNEPGRISDQAFSCLSAFVETMRARGVRVFFANPPYLASRLGAAAGCEESFLARLSVLGPLIDKREDLVFEREHFFDGPLHLNAAGRERRTAHFVQSLRPFLSGDLGR